MPLIMIRRYVYVQNEGRQTISCEKGSCTQEKPIEITGVVIPVDWDQNGKVLATAIATRDEDEFRIDTSGKGKKLLELIHENVCVNGVVREEEGKKVITVKQYSLQRKRVEGSIKVKKMTGNLHRKEPRVHEKGLH